MTAHEGPQESKLKRASMCPKVALAIAIAFIVPTSAPLTQWGSHRHRLPGKPAHGGGHRSRFGRGARQNGHVLAHAAGIPGPSCHQHRGRPGGWRRDPARFIRQLGHATTQSSASGSDQRPAATNLLLRREDVYPVGASYELLRERARAPHHQRTGRPARSEIRHRATAGRSLPLGWHAIGCGCLTGAKDIGPSEWAAPPASSMPFDKGVDWQLWIQSGDFPLPRKVVLTTTTDEARPQYSATYTWNLAASFMPVPSRSFPRTKRTES